nr:Kinesin-like protein [Ipomoea batatas]
MCKALLPGDDEGINDEAIWETLPHFWVAISMVFFVAATVFTLLKLTGDVGALGWWDLFINYGYYNHALIISNIFICIGSFRDNSDKHQPFLCFYSIAECFAFLVCTKWTNPMIHRSSPTREPSSSASIRYLDWFSSEDQSEDRMCGLQDIGGHLMKIPIICFQVLLCMRLEGTPAGARFIPLPVLFSPIFVLQGAAVLFSLSRFIEKIVLLLRSGAVTGRYQLFSSRLRDCFAFIHHGSRLLGWWSIDEANREEQARLFYDGASGYNTFSGYPPEIVKKMPKKDLAEENTALGQRLVTLKLLPSVYQLLLEHRNFGAENLGDTENEANAEEEDEAAAKDADDREVETAAKEVERSLRFAVAETSASRLDVIWRCRKEVKGFKERSRPSLWSRNRTTIQYEPEWC